MKQRVLPSGTSTAAPNSSHFLIGLLLMIGASLGNIAQAQSFTVIQKTREHINGIERIHYVVQNGSNPLNRFGVERVVSKNPITKLLVRPLILEPPLNSGAKFYTLGNSGEDALDAPYPAGDGWTLKRQYAK